MAAATDQDDDQFDIALAAWRQFHGLCLDLPAPTQPDVDARLARYQRAHETGALRDFGAATVLLAGIGKALADSTRIFATAATPEEILVFVVTCALLVATGVFSLARLRRAVEHRSLAQRIGTETIPWSKADSMFADARDPDVRAYLASVRSQGRALRRAEAAVALERARGGAALADASEHAFAAHLRGRSGVTQRELGTAAACLIAALAARMQGFEPDVLMPGLLLLGAWAFADLLGTALQVVRDPWELAGGGPRCRRVRLLLLADLVPEVAVIGVVVATTAGIAGLVA